MNMDDNKHEDTNGGSLQDAVLDAVKQSGGIEALEADLARAKKQRFNAVMFVVVGVFGLLIWVYCYFSPAIWTNYVRLLVIGAVSITAGAYRYYVANRAMTEASSRLDRWREENQPTSPTQA
jgi:hypothetical protein